MVDDAQGPEPTGWELMRGLRDLKDEIGKIGGRVVSVEVYNADKQAAADRALRQEARIKDLEQANIGRDVADKQADVDREKTRRSNQFTLAIAILASVLSFAGAIVLRSIQ